MTTETRTIVSPLAAHFKRKAEFFENEALQLALALDEEMSKPKIQPPSPFVTIPEKETE